jgi:hypothetical protein
MIMNRAGKPDRSLLWPILVVGALLSGCANIDPFQRDVDQTSPAAAEVQAALEVDRDYPRWSEFPAAPKDVPGPGEVRRRVVALEREGATLYAWARANPQMVSDTAAFAAQGLGQINPSLARKAPEGSAAQTEAFARSARALATPPPIAK